MPEASLDFASIGLLRTFVTVVEAGGFSAAAKQLQLVSSTVSKHIGLLESGLRVALIHRTTRNLEVTAAGRRFYERCRAILGEADQASLLAEPPATVAGELRILAPPSFTSSVLLRELPGFTARYPELVVDLRVGAGTVDLIREGIDVCLSLDEIHRNKSPAIKLGDNSCFVCASPEYIERHGAPQTPMELRRHRGLVGHGSPFAEEWPFRVGRAVKKYPVRRVFASNHGDALRTWCLQGFGLGGFYGFHVADDLRSGRLVEVLSNYRANPSAVYALVQHRKYTTPPIRAFVEYMRDVCSRLTTLS